MYSITPVKKIVALAFCIVLGVGFTTHQSSSKHRSSTNVQTEEATTDPKDKTQKIINTAWQLKFYDCQDCVGRPKNLYMTFIQGGVGTVGAMPLIWKMKADTVYIKLKSDDACRFKKVVLAEDNLLYGAQVCDDDANISHFIANKVGVVPEHLISMNAPANAVVKEINAKLGTNPTATTATKPATTTGTPVIANASKVTTAPANKTNIVTATATNSAPLTVAARPAIEDKRYLFKGTGQIPGYGERDIDVIIIHSTFCDRSSDPFDFYCTMAQFKRHRVSSHYIIDRQGNIHRLVDEKNIAFHAGFGKLPDGYNAINHRSLGIEMISSETQGPTDDQYKTLAWLVKDIKSRYSIKYIKGHSQIAPARKTDPWLFNWKQFNSLLKEDADVGP
jgi:N-acetyl-anhydromuramyl-L-alanine amidase AmpD